MFKAPTQTPPLGLMLSDLPCSDARALARHLGVSARTLARWIAADAAPRPVMLALFWETRWGLSVAHCDAVNGERVALGLARALQAETAMLRTRIARLEETGDFGAANAPLWRVV